MTIDRARIRRCLDQEPVHDALLTVAEAAIYADVSEQQIRDWKRRGHLHPTDHHGPRRRPLFLAIDVLRAKHAAERNLARTQAVNLASRRASVPA